MRNKALVILAAFLALCLPAALWCMVSGEHVPMPFGLVYGLFHYYGGMAGNFPLLVFCQVAMLLCAAWWLVRKPCLWSMLGMVAAAALGGPIGFVLALRIAVYFS